MKTISLKEFEIIKSKSLNKWNTGIHQTKESFYSWWDGDGSLRCSFCDRFKCKEYTEYLPPVCPLDCIVRCAIEWEKIYIIMKTYYRSSDYIINELHYAEIMKQCQLLFDKIVATKYDPKWENR